ncbi:MAG: hypothetical protein ACN6OY_02145, partial [Pseudomonas alloputida]
AEGGDHHQRQGACQEFSHQAWVLAKNGVAMREIKDMVRPYSSASESLLRCLLAESRLIIPKLPGAYEHSLQTRAGVTAGKPGADVHS